MELFILIGVIGSAIGMSFMMSVVKRLGMKVIVIVFIYSLFYYGFKEPEFLLAKGKQLFSYVFNNSQDIITELLTWTINQVVVSVTKIVDVVNQML